MAERQLRRVCVFCGSNVGRDGCYRAAAEELGRQLATRGQALVYGGGSVGLMGVLADVVLASGGEVIGVIPRMLATKELLHSRVADMRVVADMHSRKALMAELSDGFIALPGGYGTFEELLEVITWGQLGIHEKPVGLLNVAGFFDPLIAMFEHAIAKAFIKPEHRRLIVVEEHAAQLLDSLATHDMPAVRKWMGPDEI